MTDTDVVCTANGNSELDGLLTVFHTERSSNSLANKQNDLPVLHATDKAALKELAKEFELDFVSLSFTRHGDDLDQARQYLKSIGLDTTRVSLSVPSRAIHGLEPFLTTLCAHAVSAHAQQGTTWSNCRCEAQKSFSECCPTKMLVHISVLW